MWFNRDFFFFSSLLDGMVIYIELYYIMKGFYIKKRFKNGFKVELIYLFYVDFKVRIFYCVS